MALNPSIGLEHVCCRRRAVLSPLLSPAHKTQHTQCREEKRESSGDGDDRDGRYGARGGRENELANGLSVI